MEYTRIGIACFAKYDLARLEQLVDSAIRLEGRFWGSGQVHIRRTDPNISEVENQFRQTKFAGLHWHDNLKKVVSSVEYLLVIGKVKDIKEMKLRLSKYPNVKRVKYIHV